MVRDGIYYGSAMLLLALFVGWLTTPALAVIPIVLAAFFLWFFRDPDRDVPQTPGTIVSPADGKVTDLSTVAVEGAPKLRISIFLNVFDVHVNRSPVAGRITNVYYQKGKFGNAMAAASSDANEQNIVTVDSEDGSVVVFKQIAGLLARRIVFTKKRGDYVARGERIGMMKFGSRMDVMIDASSALRVNVGDRVKGGVSVLAIAKPQGAELITAGLTAAKENDGK